MQIDVSASISRLLYENDKVIIPGLGGLVATYQHTTIDQVQGVFSPPTKDLSFNPNLTTNDGLLINHIKTRYNTTFSEAEQAISRFVAEANALFDKRENVALPEVGKLFKDYSGQIQFVSDSNNFNSSSYGLPEVQFHRVIRDGQPAHTADSESKNTGVPAAAGANVATTASQNTTVPIPTEMDKEVSYYLQRAIPLLAVLAILVVGMSIYLVTSKNNAAAALSTAPDANTEQSAEETSIRINQKPALADESIYTEEGVIIEKDETQQSSDNASPIIDTEGETLAPNQKECVIIIGGFRNKTNVERLVQRLYEAGYDAYIDKKNGITRVGAMFAYTRAREVDRKLRDVQERFAKKAWILPPEERVSK